MELNFYYFLTIHLETAMNTLQQAGPTVATMSSLEIVDVINDERKADAEEVGTRFVALRHADFMVKLQKHPGIDSTKFFGQYKDGSGRMVKCYYLPKREAELMVMSESLKVQTRVYDRLAEKEAAAIPNFADEIEAAEAWIAARREVRAQAARADLEAAQRQQLEHQVAEQAPAVAGFERIAGADGAMCVTDAAKTLQIQPHKLRDALLEMAWMYRRQGKGGYVAYQDKIHSGYLKHKVGNYRDPETGENKTNPQVLVTSKGLAQLSKLLGVSTPTPSHRRSPSRLN